MTVMTVRPKTGAVPVKAAGKQAPGPVPPALQHPATPSRRRGFTPLTPMRRDAAKSMRKLAGSLEQSHPEMTVHQHVRDAAKTLEAGNEEAAQRHLRAAMYSLSPQSIYRHGITTDDGHIQARQALHGVHRHLLLVKDITDVAAKNQAAIRRDSYGDYESGPSLPPSPVRADPNAGYGPGALAQKPTARQPGGDRALNAPARTNSGGSDPAVADPVGPQPKGSKQFARTWDEVAAVLDLAWIPDPSKAQWAAIDARTGHSPPDQGGSDEDKADSHIRSAKQAASAGQHQAAMKHLARASALTSDDGKQAQIGKLGTGVMRMAAQRGQAAQVAPWTAISQHAVTWDDVASVVELSAETGRLAVTPAPYGKPGGPGLYGVKGNKHSDYFESIVQALMRKGMDKGKASAIAWGALRKWQRGGGHVHSEVRAAATGALAEEKVAQARAHAHASTWDDVAAVVELASRPKAVELVGPHGYIHGWIYVGGPGLPSVAAHNAALAKKGITPPTKAHPALTRKPPGAVKPPAKAASAAKAKAAPSPPPEAAPGPAAKAAEPPLPAAAQPAAAKPADEASAKQVDSLNTMGSLGGKSTQKAVLKKNSLAELQGMDAEYTRRGTASGKILGAHQLVKDEIASRGAAPLPAPSPDDLKASHAAGKVAEVSGPATKQDLISAWSTSYRYKGTTESKDKRIAAFATEMHRLMSTNKQPAKCGPGCQDAHKFLGMVDKESAAQPKELQRGLTLSPAAAERMFKPGKTMDMPVNSWTNDPAMAASYAKGEKAAAGKTKVILHAAPGAKGMDISGASIWKGENEVVTGGRFSVDKVQTEGGVMNVYLTQKDFSAH